MPKFVEKATECCAFFFFCNGLKTSNWKKKKEKYIVPTTDYFFIIQHTANVWKGVVDGNESNGGLYVKINVRSFNICHKDNSNKYTTNSGKQD